MGLTSATATAQKKLDTMPNLQTNSQAFSQDWRDVEHGRKYFGTGSRMISSGAGWDQLATELNRWRKEKLNESTIDFSKEPASRLTQEVARFQSWYKKDLEDRIALARKDNTGNLPELERELRHASKTDSIAGLRTLRGLMRTNGVATMDYDSFAGLVERHGQVRSYFAMDLPPLNGSDKERVATVAKELGVQTKDLWTIMGFESGFKTDQRNLAGSGATGLIQFMPETARELGTTTNELAKMSFNDQLDYVRRYFHIRKNEAERRGRSMNNLDDLYMAVLWPAAVGKSGTTPILNIDAEQYRLNKGLDINRDGIITKSEAMAQVRKYETHLARTGFYDTHVVEAPQQQQQLASNHRTETLQSFRTKVGEDTLFVGDSLTVGYANGASKVAAIEGLMATHLQRIFPTLVKDHNPKKVVLTAGTNDLGGSEENIKGALESMVKSAKAHNKSMEIYVGTLPPIVDREPAWAEKVANINNYIRNTLTEKYGVKVVDFHQALSDGMGRYHAQYRSDGLHPNMTGYARMRAAVAEVVS